MLLFIVSNIQEDIVQTLQLMRPIFSSRIRVICRLFVTIRSRNCAKRLKQMGILDIVGFIILSRYIRDREGLELFFVNGKELF